MTSNRSQGGGECIDAEPSVGGQHKSIPLLPAPPGVDPGADDGRVLWSEDQAVARAKPEVDRFGQPLVGADGLLPREGIDPLAGEETI
ncbi:MAG: hypothetical protein ACKOH8_11715, partial [Gemmatimonadota bacterium]